MSPSASLPVAVAVPVPPLRIPAVIVMLFATGGISAAEPEPFIFINPLSSLYIACKGIPAAVAATSSLYPGLAPT